MEVLCSESKKDKNSLFSGTLASGSIAGKLLISTPSVEEDGCFDKSIIFLLTHDHSGTFGVIVNRAIASVNASVVFKSLQIKCHDMIGNKSLMFGGPVESEKGLILHSSDYTDDVLLKVNDELMLSSNTNILKHIANGSGPKDSLLMLGYACWSAGQLEEEIRTGKWIVTDYSRHLIFSTEHNSKYREALLEVGINPVSMLSTYGSA
jgi:putative transcriptional regulator